MKTLEQWDKEMLELNHEIMELKTKLRILEGRRQDLFKEHNQMVMDLQYELDKKEKENK